MRRTETLHCISPLRSLILSLPCALHWDSSLHLSTAFFDFVSPLCVVLRLFTASLHCISSLRLYCVSPCLSTSYHCVLPCGPPTSCLDYISLRLSTASVDCVSSRPMRQINGKLREQTPLKEIKELEFVAWIWLVLWSTLLFFYLIKSLCTKLYMNIQYLPYLRYNHLFIPHTVIHYLRLAKVLVKEAVALGRKS